MKRMTPSARVLQLTFLSILFGIILGIVGVGLVSRLLPKHTGYRPGPVQVTALENEVMRNCMIVAQSRNLYKGPSWAPIDIAENRDEGRLVMWRVDAYPKPGHDVTMYFVEQTKPGEEVPQIPTLCTPSSASATHGN